MKLPTSIQNMENGAHGAGTSLSPFPPVFSWGVGPEAQHEQRTNALSQVRERLRSCAVADSGLAFRLVWN
jgi:hypothetical protein